MFDWSILAVVSLVVIIFVGDALVRWRRQNAWKKHWRDAAGDLD